MEFNVKFSGSSVLSLLGHFLERVLLVTLALKKIVMILPESVSVTHRDQGDVLLFHVGVEMALNVDDNCTGALVKNGIFWPVIDQATHGHSLLLTTAEHIIPIVLSVPAAFTLSEVAEADLAQQCVQILVRDIPSPLLLW